MYKNIKITKKLRVKQTFKALSESLMWNYYNNREGYWYEVENPRYEYRAENKNKKIIALPPRNITGNLLESRDGRYIRLENKISKEFLAQYGLKAIEVERIPAINEANLHDLSGDDLNNPNHPYNDPGHPMHQGFLRIGDRVKVIGNVTGNGRRGKINELAPSGKYAWVKFTRDLSMSFNISDLQKINRR